MHHTINSSNPHRISPLSDMFRRWPLPSSGNSPWKLKNRC